MGCVAASPTPVARVIPDDVPQVAAAKEVQAHRKQGTSSLALAKEAFVEDADASMEAEKADGHKFHRSYRILDRLGRGGCAQVYSARSVGTGSVHAVKVIDIRKSPKKGVGIPRRDPRRVADSQLEVRFMQQVVQSEFCAGARESFVDDAMCYIVMDVYERTLPQALQVFDVSEYSLRAIFRDMLSALQHIHSLGIVHRDIKPDNFLCNSQQHSMVPERVCLADFGFASVLPGDGTLLQGTFGTAPYMCPEMLAGRRYNEKADVWSLGVITYVLLVGQFPYTPREYTGRAIKAAIKKPEAPPSYTPKTPLPFPSQVAISFVKSMLNRKHFQRVSAVTARQHPFLADSPPDGRKWSMQSLRDTVAAASKIGAFQHAQEKTNPDVDQLLLEKQLLFHADTNFEGAGELAEYQERGFSRTSTLTSILSPISAMSPPPSCSRGDLRVLSLTMLPQFLPLNSPGGGSCQGLSAAGQCGDGQTHWNVTRRPSGPRAESKSTSEGSRSSGAFMSDEAGSGC